MFITKIVNSLAKHKVDYGIAGGFAVALHGVVRGTVDLDLIININLTSLERAERALQDCGLEARLPVSAKDLFSYREEYIKNRNLIAWSFVNSHKPIEVVDIIITEDLKNIKVVRKKAFGATLKVISIDDLIKLKKKAGRKQDIEDVKALESLK